MTGKQIKANAKEAVIPFIMEMYRNSPLERHIQYIKRCFTNKCKPSAKPEKQKPSDNHSWNELEEEYQLVSSPDGIGGIVRKIYQKYTNLKFI